MKRISLLVIALMCSISMFAQDAAAPAQKPAATPTAAPTAAQVINRQISGVEREFVPLVEAMPEEKFDFAPTNGEFKGVRTFGKMVKHVAVTNVLMASVMLGQALPKLTDEESDNGPADVKTKAQVVQYLKDSFALLHKAADSTTEQNLMMPVANPFGKGNAYRLGLFISNVGHSRDHYGQLVEYVRDNGIIPPASRPQPKK
jgi:DinB superfamily